MTVTSRNEMPVVFEAAGEQLFGILTSPAGEPNGITVLTLWGAGGFPTFGKNQVRIRLARELAGLGFHVLRIDYRGIGESGGAPREVDFEKPWTEDAQGALRWLDRRGLRRVLIIGLCFGARTGLAAASAVPELAGIALIAPPVGQADHREAILEHPLSWYLKRATAPGALHLLIGGGAAKRRRSALKARIGRVRIRRGQAPPPRLADANPAFLEPLGSVLAARVPVLFIYGREDDFFPDFDRARSGVLGQMLERAGDLATLRIIEHQLGGLASLEAQQTFLDVVTRWAGSVARNDEAAAKREAGVGLQLD